MKKRKLLIIALLLFAVIGIAGYGAYSYYYTESTMSTETPNDASADNVIRITGEFNPTVGEQGESSNEQFLGEGGSIDLVCPETTGINKQITCTSTIYVNNEGSTPIRVAYGSLHTSASSDDISVSVARDSISWSNTNDYYTTISAGSSRTLEISAVINVGDPENNNISNNEAELVTGPVAAGTLSAYASFNLSASQTDYGD